MTRTKAIRCGIYARISSDRDGGALGVKRQEADCRRIAADRGWQVIEPAYIDNDISAADRRKVRPAYNRLLADIRARNVDAVAVWDLDRLTRQPAQLEEFVTLCDEAGVTQLATVSGTIDVGTGDGMLVARIKGAVAAEEVRKTRQRRVRANRDQAERGQSKGGGRRGFGWKREKGVIRDGTVHDEAEAELIREAAKRVLAGESIRAICSDWNARSIPTVSGKPWTPNSVKAPLRNPRNAGLRQHKPVGSTETALYPAEWPAILKRDVWDQLQTVLSDPGRRTNGGTCRSYLFSGGLVRCGLCGTPLTGKPLNKPIPADPNRKRRYYKCSRDRHGCGKILIDAEHLEGFVVPLVLLWVDDPRVRQLTSDENEAAAAEIRTLTLDNAKDAAQIEEWMDLVMTKVITPAKFTQHRKPVDARMALRTARIGELQGESVLDRFTGRVSESWDELSTDDQRIVVRALIDGITVNPAVTLGFNRFDPKRVDIDWRWFNFGQLAADRFGVDEIGGTKEATRALIEGGNADDLVRVIEGGTRAVIARFKARPT